MQNETKKTRLWERHKELGAKISPFSGYEMPLWYSSAKNEHIAVLTTAGIFDTSHMSPLKISGAQAVDLLQFSFSRDLRYCLNKNTAPLQTGKSVYGVILNSMGHVVDDAILSQTGTQEFILMVNAGMGDTIRNVLQNHANHLGIEAEICDLTDLVGKIDLQGPYSAHILQNILKNPAKYFQSLDYFSFKGHFEPQENSIDGVELLNSIPVLLSRSGYTGEFGFEILIEAQHSVYLWDVLMQAGEQFGIQPCGLAARDSLRTGAVLPLSHQDIGDWPFQNNPWTFALPFNSDKTGFTKNFMGAEALMQTEQTSYTYPFIGYDPRKIEPGKDSTVSFNGEKIGKVLTCTTDMGTGWHQDRVYSLTSPDRPSEFKPRGICCGFIKVDRTLQFNQEVEIQDLKRGLKVQVTKDIRPNRSARKNLFPETL